MQKLQLGYFFLGGICINFVIWRGALQEFFEHRFLGQHTRITQLSMVNAISLDKVQLGYFFRGGKCPDVVMTQLGYFLRGGR